MTWVVIRTLAAWDTVETVDVVVMAEEVAAEVGWCLQRFRGTYFYHRLR